MTPTVRGTWELLIRDLVRHLEDTNRPADTRTIHRRATLGLVRVLEASMTAGGAMPSPSLPLRPR